MSDDDSTHRFDPAEFREDGKADGATDDSGATPDGPSNPEDSSASDGSAASDAATPARDPRTEDREFDWRGWVLVGMLFVAFVVVPVLLYFVPRAQWLAASIGLSYRDAFLVLPLVPALLLGALAVWATTRP